MRIENQGLSLWYGTPDAPGPGTVVPAGAEVPITVGMSPADASNKVDVRYRINGGAAESLSAPWFRNSGDAQYFTARLPPFQEDHQVEWWVTARCAGKYVPAHAEADTAVLTFRAARAETMVSASWPSARPELRTRQSTSAARLPGPPGEVEASNSDAANPTMVRRPDLARASARRPATSTVTLAETTREDEEGDSADSEDGNAPAPAPRATPKIGAAAGSAEELAGPPGAGPTLPSAATESADPAIDTRQPAEKNKDLEPQEISAAPTGQPASVSPGAAPASSLGLAELARSLGVNLPPALAERNAETAAGLLASHARGQFDSLPPRDCGPVEDLVAHAALSTIGADVGHRAILMASGYRAPADLAAAGRDEFVRSVSAGVGAAEAIRIHAAATAQATALGAVQTAERVERVGRPADRLEMAAASPLADAEAAADCGCRDCQAATSPMAYLTDLLRYATARLSSGGGRVTVADLSRLLQQPLTELPADCGTSERDVNQVRLVAESLLRVIQAAFDEEPAGVADRYTWTAYQALLTQLGTSYQELRQVRGQPTAERQALTDRLGLHRDGTRPDVLDALLMAPGTVSLDGLEELFGLVSTGRDPLSDGLVRGSSAAQVRRWHLTGADWSADPACSSTSPDGTIHLTVTASGAGQVSVEAYRDTARTVRIAAGHGNPAGPIPLTGDVVSGTIELTSPADSNAAELLAHPRITVSRWQRLRDLWDAEDWPDDPYAPGPVSPDIDPLPMVDPDVISVNDFRLPLPKAPPRPPSGDGTAPVSLRRKPQPEAPASQDGAFDLWIRRREWLDKLINDLRGQQDIDNLLNTLRPPGPPPFDPGELRHTPGLPPATYPWSDAPADLTALSAQLTSGAADQATAAAETVRTRLHLPVDAFLRLMAVRERSRAGQQLTPAEWVEVRSILVLAHKRYRFPDWRAEETGIRLDTATFVATAASVAEGEWPPEPPPEDQLLAGEAPPLVDPERLAITDIPVSAAGADARELWHRRVTELAGNAAAVRAAATWAQQLSEALGPPPSAISRAAWITKRAADLEDLNPETVTAAEKAIRDLVGITLAAFRRLAAVNARIASGLAVTEAERQDAEHILTQARKVKQLYPLWRAEENTSGRPLRYWQARRPVLPRWRATAENRQAWQAALTARCRPPVVDPDLPPTWLRSPTAANITSQARRLRDERAARLSTLEQWLRTVAGDRTDVLGIDAQLLAGLWTDDEVARVRADITARRAASSASQVMHHLLGAAAAARLPGLLAALDTGGQASAAARRELLDELGFSGEEPFREIMAMLAREPATQLRASATEPAPTAVVADPWEGFDATLAYLALIRQLTGAERATAEAGGRLADRLAPLRLSPQALRRLLAIRRLAIGGSPVLPEERNELIATVLRAAKERLFGQWREQERGAAPGERIRLGPDSFAQPVGSDASPGALDQPGGHGRVTPGELTWWLNTFTARAGQHRQVLASSADAVVRVEEQALPTYRGDLLAALPVPEGRPAAWAADSLLVDMADSGCRRTTRVGHAIDAVLALLWSVRTGQLRDVYPTLVLDAPAFDEDWRWIGSYATWRSAMLVHLYPENLLRPSLRRHQSPALRQAISDLRDARQLSPAGARRVAARYAGYFADICQLDLDRLICAKAQLPYIPVMLVLGDGTARDCDVYVAMSSVSKRVYWTVRDLTVAAAATGYDLGFWHHLDQLGTGEVTELVGLTGYAPKNDPAAGRWLYMFAETQSLDGRSLVFLRLDLTTGNWAAEPTPLEAPQGVSEFRAWLYPADATQPPRVGLEFTTSIDGVPQLSRVSRALNAKGTSWERADFAAIGGYGAWQPIPSGSVDVSALTPVKAVLNGDFIGIGHDQTVVVPRAAESQSIAQLIFKYGQPEWRTWEDLLLPSAALAAAGRFVTVAGSDRDAIALVWPAGETWHSVGQAWLYRVNDKLTGWQATQGWEVPSSVVPYTVTAGHFVATELAQLAVVAGLRTTDTGPSVWILVPVQEVLKPAFQSHAAIATGYDYRLDYEKSVGMTFRCCPSTKSGIFSLGESVPPGLAVAGDFDGDGRDELAITPAPLVDDLSRGNDLWVWDWSPSRGGWAPLGEVSKSPLRTVYDLSTAPFSLLSAVTGDFDGDGRDELALIPDIVDGRIPNTVRILDYQPLRWNTDPAVNGTWGELTALELDRDVSTPVRHGVAGDFDADGAEELLVIGDGWLRIYKYDLRTKTWAAFPLDGLGLEDTASFVAIANYGWNPHPNRKPPRGRRDWGIADQALIQPGMVTPAGTGAGLQRRIEGNSQAAARVLPRRFDPWPTQPRYCPPGYLIPVYDSAIGWVLDDTSPEATRRQRTQTALEANRGAPGTILRYLAEAFYDLPVAIALALQDAHDYGHALDWYRLVYDYTRPPEDRNTYYGLVQDAQGIPDRADADPKDYARRLLEWIRDPLDPHAIAATRPHTYTRATLQLLIRCLMDYADAEFTRDTSESNTRARILYQAACELLDLPVLTQRLDGCIDVIARIPATTEPATIPEQPQPRTVAAASGSPGPAGLPGITGPPEPASMTRERDIPAGTASNGGSGGRTDGDRSGTTVAGPVTMMPTIAAPALLATAVTHSAATRRSGLSLLAQLNGAATELSGLIDPGAPLPHAPASPGPVFCVSPNPMLKALRLHAELNLYKIRTCRNISGLRRELEAYAAPTDQESGLPMIGADGQLVLPGNRTATATPYRYATLIERARQLAGQARDIEASMLAALQNRDAEALNLLRARQEVRVARASVRLQELRVNQAEDRVTLTQLQQQRATFEEQHYQDLLDAGQNAYELEALGLLEEAARWQTGAAIASLAAAAADLVAAGAYFNLYWDVKSYPQAVSSLAAVASATSSAFSSFAANASTMSQWNSMRAGFERTRQDWEFRKSLAGYDRQIAGQQVTVETDGVRIAEQEREIGDLQADNAEQLLEFQQVKFTNVELYDWMAGVLERTYRWFLQQGTAIAQLAAQQLAFERQEGEPPAIQADYWEPPAEGMAALTGEGTGPDRRGLTGAARLLQDIAALDQYAFETNRRKLQLTKTISLAQYAPLDLQRLRSDGVTSFTTPLRIFDQDFPGHHLRMIRRVTVSVVALVPPAAGIQATLSTTGMSRIVVGPDIYRAIVLRRPPESVALTSPIGASGVFTFEQPTGMRDPFEGLGVDTPWELRLPKPANPFDYTTLADVLITIDYTALDSADYRAQVIRDLDQTADGERAFSLRQEFPDAWWDLHNPGQTDTPLQVTFTTGRADFPPNLDELSIAHVALVLATDTAVPAELTTITLRYTEQGATGRLGGPAGPVDRVVSTRRANGGPWLSMTGKPPVGRWELALPATEEIRNWLAADGLNDLLLVLSYRGRTSPWPG